MIRIRVNFVDFNLKKDELQLIGYRIKDRNSSLESDSAVVRVQKESLQPILERLNRQIDIIDFKRFFCFFSESQQRTLKQYRERVRAALTDLAGPSVHHKDLLTALMGLQDEINSLKADPDVRLGTLLDEHESDIEWYLQSITAICAIDEETHSAIPHF